MLTYWLVEKPIRFGKTAQRLKVWGLIITMLLVGCLGLYIWHYDGLPNRSTIKEHVDISHELSPPPRIDKAGLHYTGMVYGTLGFCRYSNTKFEKTVAVIGDSHAHSAYHGIQQLGKQLQFNTVLLGWSFPKDVQREIPPVIDILLKKKDIHKIFIVTRGPAYLTGIDFIKNTEQARFQKMPQDVFATSLQDTVTILADAGKQVYIVAENPELPDDPSDYIDRPFRKTKKVDDFPPALKKNVLIRMDVYLGVLHEIKGATIIDTINIFCPDETCRVFNERGIPLYWDNDHLSYAGSEFQVEQILKPYLLE